MHLVFSDWNLLICLCLLLQITWTWIVWARDPQRLHALRTDMANDWHRPIRGRRDNLRALHSTPIMLQHVVRVIAELATTQLIQVPREGA